MAEPVPWLVTRAWGVTATPRLIFPFGVMIESTPMSRTRTVSVRVTRSLAVLSSAASSVEHRAVQTPRWSAGQVSKETVTESP